jgi:hypothetical protein
MASQEELYAGAMVVQKVARSRAAAEACIEYLMGLQTSDELSAGTSIHLNGVGLSKLDAQAIADRGVPRDLKLREMVCRYSTQLGRGVTDGSLRIVDLPPDGTAKCVAPDGIESESDSEQEECDGSLVTRFGIINDDRLVVPSRNLKAALLSISIQKSRESESDDSEAPPWRPEDVMTTFNEREHHFGTALTMRSVDDALFHTSSEGATEAGQWIRVYWSSERKWATCRVDRIDEKMGVNRTLHVTFHDEDGSTGVLTGDDTHMVYALRHCGPARDGRRRKRRVLDELEDVTTHTL